MNKASSPPKSFVLKVFLVFLLLLLVLFFAGFFLLRGQRAGNQASVANQASEAAKANRRLAEKANRPFLGNPNAKVVVVEFADFQCPNCQNEFFAIREIAAKYQDQILYLYRQFPTIDENSLYLSLVSLCAHEQGKFWPWHDKMFLNPARQNDSAFLVSLSAQLGIDQDQLDKCVADKKHEKKLLEDVSDAYQLGVKGTPTFFINGVKIAGAVSLADWEEIIGKALALNP